MKLIKIFIIGISLIGVNSCTKDFLELVPFTSESSEAFYKTEEQLSQAVAGAYSHLQDYCNQAWYLEELQSDNTIIDNATGNGVLGRFSAEESFSMGSEYKIIRDAWRRIYNAISDINIILSKLPDADAPQEVKDRFEGELSFLRAYYYFVAVRYWGGVPLVTEPLGIDEAFSTGRASVNEIYTQIIADLKIAENNLPAQYTENSDVGRATKGAALTLLGKVYLTNHDYAKAITELRKVQTLGVYQLAGNYTDLWGVENENGPESVFEVQYMEGVEFGQYSGFQYYFAPVWGTASIENPPYRGGGWNIPTKDMISTYEPGDLRLNASIVFDTITNNYPEGVDTTFIVGSCIKYNSPHAVPGQTGNNWIILRYADVLLMLSEALNQQGFNSESFDLINEIRSRAGLPDLTQADVSDQAAFRLAMEKERRIEFVFENHRWFDLLRTGRAIEVITAYGKIELADLTTPECPSYPIGGPDLYVIEEFELLYPIPVDEIIINDIGQNPGYN